MPRIELKKVTRAPNDSGFTLIELMIAVLIVGILASVAVVNYSQHVLRSHRTDARIALKNYAAKQERYFSRNNAYAPTLADLGAPDTSEGGRYTITLNSDDAFVSTFNITATAAGSQAEDTDCVAFTLNSLGVSSAVDDGGAAADCW